MTQSKLKFELKKGIELKVGDRVYLDGNYKTIVLITDYVEGYFMMHLEDGSFKSYFSQDLFDVENYHGNSTSCSCDLPTWSTHDIQVFNHKQFKELKQILLPHIEYQSAWDNYDSYPKVPIEYIQFLITVNNNPILGRNIKTLQCQILDDCGIERESKGNFRFDSRTTGVFPLKRN
jgi:hypothetical protein